VTTRTDVRSKLVSLPVLHVPGQPRRACTRAKPRRSRIWKWRVGVLIGVQVLMIVHVLHWWITGESIGRFVLSDSMRTLELGEVNPGFLLFAAALLATALFGRFMCGWVCHMGALQDLCAWMLRKIGLRPRLFRARLLGYVPLVAACYMFLWPTVWRELVQPIYAAASTADASDAAGTVGAETSRSASLPQAVVFPGLRASFRTDDLWEGLPTWHVAIPFLILSGFATVYFLGARGLCRYGCPYGGFLLPAEQVAVGRVVVDMAACDQCGLCTATCTTGVRVHDEVRMYGSITDRNCIRSLDCIGSCPQQALLFSFARPAILSRRNSEESPVSHRYDLTFGEELLCIAVFVATFATARGLYGLIPLLMAMTLGAISSFLAWKTWRLLRTPNVRLGPVQLRLHGRVRAAGFAFGAGMALGAALLVHSATMRGALWVASTVDDRVTVSYETALAGGPVTNEQRALATRALGWYAVAAPMWNGGWALASTPVAGYRTAWLQLVLNNKHAARHALAQVEAIGRDSEMASIERARILESEHRVDDALEALEEAARARPRSVAIRQELSVALFRRGRVKDAIAELASAAAARPGHRAQLDALANEIRLRSHH
jgi:ferredoxin